MAESQKLRSPEQMGVRMTRNCAQPKRFVWYGGQYVPACQIAKVRGGMSTRLIIQRLNAGVWGPALWAPATRPGGWPEGREYELGLSCRDWQPVIEYAKRRSIEAARLKFGLPRGAVRLACEGRMRTLG